MLYSTILLTAVICGLASGIPVERRGITLSLEAHPNPTCNGDITKDLRYLSRRFLHGTKTGVAQGAPLVGIEYDPEYITNITVGGQNLQVVLASAATDTWVPSLPISSSFSPGTSLYDPTKSRTAQLQQGLTFNNSYAGGLNVTGIVYKDSVKLGDLTVTGQSIEVPTNITDPDVNLGQLGIAGLGFPQGSGIKPHKQTPLFFNLIPQLQEALFTTSFKHHETSPIDFGFIDHSKYTGRIQYTPAKSRPLGWWTASPTSMSIGSQVVNTTLFDTLFDTATSTICLTGGVPEMYYARVTGASFNASLGAYTYPCTSELPTFTIHFEGNAVFTMPGNDTTYAQVIGNPSMCMGGIVDTPIPQVNVMGITALKNNFVVFDAGNERIGWARQS